MNCTTREIIKISRNFFLFCSLFTSFSLLAEKAKKPAPAQSPRVIEKQQQEYTSQDVFELIKSQQIPGDKKSFSIQRGDGKISFGGRAAQEYYFYKNPSMLNYALPDEYGFFKTTADIFLQTHWGKKQFGHKAIEAFFNLRHKSEWGGLFGRNTGTAKTSVTVGQSSSKAHNHPSTKPLIWLKDAWVKLSVGATFNQDWENQHYLKLGFFPFQLGRGISLGQGYGTPKDFLGIYNQFNDFSAPGILLSGSLLKNIVEYDLYYAKYDEKGQSAGQTFASTRENHVGKRTTPYRGVGKDDELWALQLRWTPVNTKERGTLDIKPYIFYNEASDRIVEVESDSKSRLGTGGVNFEYVHSNFEIGGECAFNFGYEELYAIDRNAIKLSNIPNRVTPAQATLNTDSDGILKEVFSHVEYTLDGTNWFPTPATAAHKAVLIRNEATENGQTFKENGATAGSVFGANAQWRNKDTRFRPNYCNQYRGWMVVGDMSYNIPVIHSKISLGAGAASGDQNPHSKEENKDYKGFIGLNELYTGGRINSIFFLDNRSIKRPLTMADNVKDAYTEDESFTDLWYLGLGGTFAPQFKGHKCCFNSNAVFFFKQHPSKKYDSETNSLKDEFASPYLGYELNIITEYTIFTDLKVSAKLAAFMPGTYYVDIKGTPLRGDFFDTLEEADKAKLDSAQYRLGNDTAYFVNFRLDYRF